MPHELFTSYWRDVHSTRCSRLPGLGFYVQPHLDRNHTANLWPFADARAAREFLATPTFQKVLARQGEHIDALGAYPVTGFYTFVRDGRPTTAGLRGSRAAELIEAAGAANQGEPAVVAMFTRDGRSG